MGVEVRQAPAAPSGPRDAGQSLGRLQLHGRRELDPSGPAPRGLYGHCVDLRQRAVDMGGSGDRDLPPDTPADEHVHPARELQGFSSSVSVFLCRWED